MANEVDVATHAVNGINGVKANGKVKSKNQLRRLKAKQKKSEKDQTAVSHTRGLSGAGCSPSLL